MKNRITDLFGIQYPLIQAGMVWVSGYKLAAAVSNAGGLGIIGAGSMKPALLREHIQQAHTVTDKPLAVNIPLYRGDAEELIDATIEEGIRIIFTSAGNPSTWVEKLKTAGCTIVHLVAAVKHALKAQKIGYDAVVAEGFEAGGHNGYDEITSFCLIPQVADAVDIPVIAAGGIADGRGMAAALALGAEAVQVGTRFAAAEESSAHQVFKDMIVDAGDADTVLALKKIGPVRLFKTPFAERALDAEAGPATKEELLELLGRKREMMGMFEGNIEEGEFEAGQISGLVKGIQPAAEIVDEIIRDYRIAVNNLPVLKDD
jgi:enoyl-[acyl-carrier protein] reductase II